MHIITLTHAGHIGHIPAESIRCQKRGGRGSQSFPLEEGDRVVGVASASDAERILVFTTQGRVFGFDLSALPEISPEQEPTNLADLVTLRDGEHPVALMAATFKEGQHILFATRHGIIKKTSAGEYEGISERGVIAIHLDEDDALIGVSMVKPEQEVYLATAGGLAIRFAQDEVNATGRDTRGVRGMRLKEGDTVTSLLVATPDETIATVSIHGFGKRSMADEYRLTSRGGSGIASIKPSERNGVLVSLTVANEDSDLLLSTQTGRLLRMPSDSIRVQSRNTAGVRLFDLEGGESIVSAIPLPAGP